MIDIRVELVGIVPTIWRQISVPSGITLDVLHFVIQGAMPWQDYHLHEFEVDKQLYEAREIDDDSWDRGDERKDERKFALGDLVKKGDTFIYTYDFGDGWRHLITVEKVGKDSGRPDLDFPSCVAGERACPPEDCGGPYSYDGFLEALADSKNPEHRSTKEWAGTFDPKNFSIQQANAAVGAMYVWGAEQHQRKKK